MSSGGAPGEAATPGDAAPHVNARTLGFVDAGRLGASLADAFQRAGYRVTAVSRRDEARARELAARLGDGVLGTTDAQRVVDAADIVFLTSVDDRLAARAAELTFRSGQAVLHCSGATSVSVLEPARSTGAATGGFHPLQTFPDDGGAARLTGVTFGVEAADRQLLGWLRNATGALGGRSVVLDDASRPLYHASAVMVGPMVSALTGLAAELWSAFGHDRGTAVRALAPLVRGTARHIEELGVPDALTGPYARGDLGPVRAHVAALAEFRPDILRAYASLALAQLPIASERGNIPGDRMRELRALLEGALSTPRA